MGHIHNLDLGRADGYKRNMNCDMFACFIGYQKAFDRIKHEKRMDVLMNMGINDKDLRFGMNLYWNQTASIKISIWSVTN